MGKQVGSGSQGLNPALGQILVPFLGNLQQSQAAHICTTKTVVTNPSRPTGSADVALHSVKIICFVLCCKILILTEMCLRKSPV